MSLNTKRYTVVIKDHISDEELDDYVDQLEHNGVSVERVLKVGSFKGLTCTMPESLVQSVEWSSLVSYVEPDQEVHTQMV